MLNKWQINIRLDKIDSPYCQHLLSIGYVYREITLCDGNKNRIIRENPPLYMGMPDSATVKIRKELNEKPTMKESILCIETYFI